MTRQQRQFAGAIGALLAAWALIGGCAEAPDDGQRGVSQRDAAPRDGAEDDQAPAFPYEEPVTEPEAAPEPRQPEPDEVRPEPAPQSEPGAEPEPAPEPVPSEPPAAAEERPGPGEEGETREQVAVETVEEPSQPDDTAARAVAAPAQRTTARLAALSDAFREVARQVKPSVVQVAAEVRPGARRHRLSSQMSPEQLEELQRRFGPLLELDPELQQFFRGRRFEEQGPDYDQYNVPLPVGNASGWIYDDRGHVVTNHHVVAKADYIKLTFYDNTEAEAVLVGSDPQTDVAMLKTDKQGLVPARLSTRGVEQGDIVLAVGSPFRYAFSLSQGIVSATGRSMGILGPQGYENFIQTDAAINPGNSGGPLTNARGEVIGMSTAIASRSGRFAGIGFAIPADMIRDVADELIRKGKVERGYLGVMISDNKRLLASFGAERGVLVEDTVEGGPAHRAGLEAGDVITAIDGRAVENATVLRRRIAQIDPGQTVQLSVLRDEQQGTVDVTLEQQPVEEPQPERSRRPSAPGPDDSAEAEAEALVKLGFERLQAITPEMSRQYGLETSSGVLVLEVRRFSAAANSGLKRGHIITHALGQKVTDVDELRAAVEGKDLTQGVRMRVKIPGGPAHFVLLSLEN